MVDEMEEAKRMSNLGAYQWLTTVAKKVGGPKNLVLIIAGTGAAVYKGSEIVVKKTVKEIKKKIRIYIEHDTCIKDRVKNVLTVQSEKG